jgi:hypothetical protein
MAIQGLREAILLFWSSCFHYEASRGYFTLVYIDWKNKSIG